MKNYDVIGCLFLDESYLAVFEIGGVHFENVSIGIRRQHRQCREPSHYATSRLLDLFFTCNIRIGTVSDP